MARKAMIEKSNKEPRFQTRKRNRCKLCGRSRGYIRTFGMCRLCFRELANKGELPGVLKSNY
ncbi:MAG TPA: type Z 30S ribosomal protein S14 [Patescibacteria group bacterium]|nr:type Z 30S ribosomal protein S14 [Patescibacteria group bacterium]